VGDMEYNKKKPGKDEVKHIALWKVQDWKHQVLNDQFPVAQTFGNIPENLIIQDESNRTMLLPCLGDLDSVLQWAKESFVGTEGKPLGLSVC